MFKAKSYQSTDITSEALEDLKKSQIETVHLVGRRGPLQASFTIAELRELVNMPGISVKMNPMHFEGIKERLNGKLHPLSYQSPSNRFHLYI